MALEKHYSGREVADQLGVDYETVLHLAHEGELPSVRVGRLRRFPESGVNAYLERRKDPAVNVVLMARTRLVTEKV